MMDGWRKPKLIELAAKKRWALNGGPFGSKLTTKYYTESGVPVIRGTNLSSGARFSFADFVWVSEEKADELLPNNAHPGDLVFTQRGTIGQVGFIPMDAPFKRFVISQSQMKLTPDPDQVDALFLYYYFASPGTVKTIENLAFAAGVPHINLEILRNFEVSLPPLPLQRRIVTILSAYEDLIENSQRRIRILESIARELYREWFVTFRFPGHEKIRRVDSALGPIPKGWSVKKLGEILELKYGNALKKEARRDGDFPVFGSSGVVGYHNASLVKGPSIIVGRKGNVGSVFWSGDDFYVIDTAFFVSSSLPLRFLFYDLQTKNFINSDAAVPGLSRHQAYSLETIIPATSILMRFCRMSDAFEQQASTLRRQVQNLRRTRDLLLPRLLSGQLEIAVT